MSRQPRAGSGAAGAPASTAAGALAPALLDLAAPVIESDAERIYLGACLAGAPDAAARIAYLNPSDFWDPRNAKVFEALASLRRRGRSVGAVAALDELRNLGSVDNWGDAPGIGPFLYDLMTIACPGPSAPWYAQQIQEAAGRRRVQQTAVRLARAATSSSLEVLVHLLDQETEESRRALSSIPGARS